MYTEFVHTNEEGDVAQIGGHGEEVYLGKTILSLLEGLGS